ncbi:MAG: HNH endonuclease [Anaeromyxobacter sp.]
MSAAAAAPGTRTRLEKAAFDNGFDRELGRSGDWLAYGSTHAALNVWLMADTAGRLVAALSRADVAYALAEHGNAISTPLPAGAAAARIVSDFPALNRLLRRAYQFARTLPQGLLHEFEQKIAGMPRRTEAERLVIQRVGQDVFRNGLLEYWEGRCAITGLAVPELLRASHIKPWADCETDAERLDVFNGLLLAPHVDAAFDAGFVTFADDGAVIVSSALGMAEQAVLGLQLPLKLQRVEPAHLEYLSFHRRNVFRVQDVRGT